MSETEKKKMEDDCAGSDGELDQPNASFIRNTMVSNTMVSGEASETDEEEDEEKDEQEKEKEEEDFKIENKDVNLRKQPELPEIQDVQLDPNAVKTKKQKIVYKFDS